MKTLVKAAARPLAALSLATLFAVSLAPSANAWFLPRAVEMDRAPIAAEAYAGYEAPAGYLAYDEDPHHRCHGRASGTASHACGTHTGGPVGGLF